MADISSILVVLLTSISSTAAQGMGTASAARVDPSGPASPRREVGRLRPSDLPGPKLFSSFDDGDSSMELPSGEKISFRNGSVKRPPNWHDVNTTIPTEVVVVPGAIPRSTVEEMMTLLRGFAADNPLDTDPDSVDGMPSYEIFIDSHNLQTRGDRIEKHEAIKVLDADPEALKHRNALRSRLQNITRPLIDDVLTPFLRARFPEACGQERHEDPARACRPCYSLIRRYRHGERQSHNTHRDGHAVATVVTSLSDYGSEYLGGLYVGTDDAQREYVALDKGDAVFHRPVLLHGVRVMDLEDRPEATERWSWILWYQDSATCADHSEEWFKDCAEAGDAICQSIHAFAENVEGEESKNLVLRAAAGGESRSNNKMAQKLLEPEFRRRLGNDAIQGAKYYFSIAARSDHPEAHFGLAGLWIEESNSRSPGGPEQCDLLAQAVGHLEAASAVDHPFSMFNLGIAHIFGYGIPGGEVDMELGVQWVVRSGLPEGYSVAAFFAGSVIGDEALAQRYHERAVSLGAEAPWRKIQRQQQGELNLKWPPSPSRNGMRPPKF